MAAIYWVNGNGIWGTASGNWGTASGGTSIPGLLPGTADEVTIDSSSGTPTIKVKTDIDVQKITFSISNCTFISNGYNITLRGTESRVLDLLDTSNVIFNLSTSTVTLEGGTAHASFGYERLQMNAKNAHFVLNGETDGIIVDPNANISIGTITINGNNCYFKVGSDGGS